MILFKKLIALNGINLNLIERYITEIDKISTSRYFLNAFFPDRAILAGSGPVLFKCYDSIAMAVLFIPVAISFQYLSCGSCICIIRLIACISFSFPGVFLFHAELIVCYPRLVLLIPGCILPISCQYSLHDGLSFFDYNCSSCCSAL